jgi:hypothetical protein
VTSNDITLDEWEKHSIFYGNLYKSVLFKNMSDIVNKHFHISHLKFIEEFFIKSQIPCPTALTGSVYAQGVQSLY